MQSNYAQSVRGTLNFAADRSDGGEFSNGTPERSRQKLQAVEVEISNGRLRPQPTLENEGLMLVKHPSGRADWSNSDWIASEYVSSCVALVKQLTGAKTAFPIYVPLQRRVNYGEYQGAAPTAGFVHLDQTREIAREMATQLVKGEGIRLERAAIYNVWKCMTPSPQDYPLAVSDVRSVPVEDHVLGNTVEYIGEKKEKFLSPYLTLFPSGRPKFYYFPDMTPDESLVFIGVDLDASKPLGCAHSAFRHPSPDGPTVPRASIEARVIALFD